MIARAESLPIGSWVCKTGAWQDLAVLQHGTTTSAIDERWPAPDNVDVHGGDRGGSEAVHLSCLQRLIVGEDPSCQ